MTTTSGLNLSLRPGTSNSMDFDYSADSSPSTSSRNINNITSTNNVAAGAANRNPKHEVSQEPSESSHVDAISPNSPPDPIPQPQVRPIPTPEVT
uniref:Uncharacterized protein n=1 Tax=Ditylenchus dipsaci TaxID=166011 RepID=A0A915D726_9BILA